MNYTQSKTRSNLKDSTMTVILHVQDVVLSDPQQPLSGRVKLKVYLPHSLCDRMKMEQNVGLKVCDCFEGVRSHGEVRQVKFHEIYSQYMYDVVFSDNDKQDYWRHELEVIKCRYDEEDSEGVDSLTVIATVRTIYNNHVSWLYQYIYHF